MWLLPLRNLWSSGKIHGCKKVHGGKESACNTGDPGLILGSRRSLGRKWQPTPVFLPGESHGQRSLAGYGP